MHIIPLQTYRQAASIHMYRYIKLYMYAKACAVFIILFGYAFFLWYRAKKSHDVL